MKMLSSNRKIEGSAKIVRDVLLSREPRTIPEIILLTQLDQQGILDAFKKLGAQLAYRGVATVRAKKKEQEIQAAKEVLQEKISAIIKDENVEDVGFWLKREDGEGDELLKLKGQLLNLEREKGRVTRDENRWEVTLWEKLPAREKITWYARKIGINKSKGGWHSQWPDLVTRGLGQPT